MMLNKRIFKAMDGDYEIITEKFKTISCFACIELDQNMAKDQFQTFKTFHFSIAQTLLRNVTILARILKIVSGSVLTHSLRLVCSSLIAKLWIRVARLAQAAISTAKQ